MSSIVPLFNAQYPIPTAWIQPSRAQAGVPPQKGTNWCWAAVAFGIELFYDGVAEEQCKIATRVVKTCCCPYGIQPRCDTSQDLPPALNQHYEAESRDTTWKQAQFVEDQVDQGKPLAVRVEWSNNGGGHFVVISRYVEVVIGDPDLYISEPETGLTTPWRLSQFTTAYEGNGAWDITFTTKR